MYKSWPPLSACGLKTPPRSKIWRYSVFCDYTLILALKALRGTNRPFENDKLAGRGGTVLLTRPSRLLPVAHWANGKTASRSLVVTLFARDWSARMALSELTSHEAVLAAIKEFDELGDGFGPARQVFLEHGTRHYDSKAIAGVAYGNQFPDRGPLKSNEFSGGEETVGHLLERLGFKVSDVLSVNTPRPAIEPAASSGRTGAWIFQANPAYYDLRGALQGLTVLTWLVKQHTDDIKQGDTVYLWEGGADAGIVAVATVTGGPALRGENEQETDFVRDPTKFAGEQSRVCSVWNES
jgi:hypothetical protein